LDHDLVKTENKQKESVLYISTNSLVVPELRIYRFWDRPLGPHPLASFEVNLFTPAQFGAFIPWLIINRGPLSVLIHPNTVIQGEEVRNHTQRATWLGEPVALDIGFLMRIAAAAGSDMGGDGNNKVQ
jgi:aromatic ring-cleaving dioxygenase